MTRTRTIFDAFDGGISPEVLAPFQSLKWIQVLYFWANKLDEIFRYLKSDLRRKRDNFFGPSSFFNPIQR